MFEARGPVNCGHVGLSTQAQALASTANTYCEDVAGAGAFAPPLTTP